MMPLQLEALLGGQAMLLQQVALLGVQRITVGNGGGDRHLIVGV